MGARENAEAVRGNLEAYNRREFGKASVQPGAKVEIVPFGVSLDYDAYNDLWSKAFPDSRIEVKSLTADDRSVAVEFLGKGTHEGALEIPGRRVEPTHRYGELRFVMLMELQNGKVTGGRVYFDLATLMSNLGLSPEMAAGKRPEAGAEARH